MRRELLTFAVDPPVRHVEADPDVAGLVTLLVARRGGTVVGVFPDAGGSELAVVVELDDHAPAVDVDLGPRLQLRDRRVHAAAPATALPQPRIVEPDPTVVDPRPRPWQSIEVQPEGEALVTFMRGAVERLHSVEATGDRITVYVGTVPGGYDGPVLAVGIVERARVRLPRLPWT